MALRVQLRYFDKLTCHRADKARGKSAFLNVFFQSTFFDAPRSKEH
jgi:hypothetical protein